MTASLQSETTHRDLAASIEEIQQPVILTVAGSFATVELSPRFAWLGL